MEVRNNWSTGERTHPNNTRNIYSSKTNSTSLLYCTYDYSLECALSRARFVIIGVVIGALIAGIGLGTVITMYVSDQSKTSISI